MRVCSCPFAATVSKPVSVPGTRVAEAPNSSLTGQVSRPSRLLNAEAAEDGFSFRVLRALRVEGLIQRLSSGQLRLRLAGHIAPAPAPAVGNRRSSKSVHLLRLLSVDVPQRQMSIEQIQCLRQFFFAEGLNHL